MICLFFSLNIGEAQSQLAIILDELTALKKEEPAVNEQNLGKIGSALLKGAQVVGKGMEMGAEKATHLIEYVSEKQKAKIQDRSPDEDVKVNKAIVTSVKGAKYATNATVKVSGFVSKRVGKVSYFPNAIISFWKLRGTQQHFS